jgi:LPXTG-site transpeptidase (sortase) family protein
MAKNPLFPGNDNATSSDAGRDEAYVLHNRQHQIQPLSDEEKVRIGANPAADLIREKLAKLYASEPDAREEEREAEVVRPRSRHQQFMYELSTSGKSLAEIQTEWHNYYVALPDEEKHRVWQEFYENNQPGKQPELSEPAPKKAKEFTTHQAADKANAVVGTYDVPPPADTRKPGVIREHIRKTVNKHADKLSPGTRQNLRSLLFGLSVGAVVLVIFLFSFFNEVIIAPFIQPGRTSAAPVIVTSDSVDATQPTVIIPKINVQIPTVFEVPSNSEADIQAGLENGVVHYPTTPKPGEIGNTAFFGHSSNNIFNKGRYKFAFVLLHKIQDGDTFYLTYNGVVYGYKVIDTKIVPPNDVSVLDSVPGENATATLITCDPPGTTINRLIVVGRQVSPNPATNTSSTASASTAPGRITDNGPTLWSRLWNSIF